MVDVVLNRKQNQSNVHNQPKLNEAERKKLCPIILRDPKSKKIRFSILIRNWVVKPKKKNDVSHWKDSKKDFQLISRSECV